MNVNVITQTWSETGSKKNSKIFSLFFFLPIFYVYFDVSIRFHHLQVFFFLSFSLLHFLVFITRRMKWNFHSLREELMVKEDVDEDKTERWKRRNEDEGRHEWRSKKLQEPRFFVDAKKKEKEKEKSLGRFRILCLFTWISERDESERMSVEKIEILKEEGCGHKAYLVLKRWEEEEGGNKKWKIGWRNVGWSIYDSFLIPSPTILSFFSLSPLSYHFSFTFTFLSSKWKRKTREAILSRDL